MSFGSPRFAAKRGVKQLAGRIRSILHERPERAEAHHRQRCALRFPPRASEPGTQALNLRNCEPNAYQRVEAFSSPAEFLSKNRPDVVSCLVLDVRLPESSGLDFQRELADANIDIPIIFITGHGDIPMTVQAMKAGAVDFLTKPFREQDLLDAVNLALARDRSRRQSGEITSALHARFALLTTREREIFALATKALTNRSTAAEIEVCEMTVKVHRRSLMTKLGARTFAELVRMADALGLHSDKLSPDP